jgi:hypothetical protein
MIGSEEVKQNWIAVLGTVFKNVDWKKMRGGRRSYLDIFEHRLRYASHEEDVGRLIERLCSGLSLQAPPIPLDCLEELEKREEESMQMVRQYGKFLTLYAARYAGYH